MTDHDAILPALRERAGSACELCGAADAGHVHPVGPAATGAAPSAHAILVCDACDAATSGPSDHATHLRCLQQAASSDVPAVQVASYRLLYALTEEPWAADLLSQVYLDEGTLAWAEAELATPPGGPAKGVGGHERRPTVDSNGAVLMDGDSVTLIKDLEVKGAGFTAKRGTLVKGIRLTDDPELIDARVNKIAIVLKTCFLKKA